MAIGGYFLGYRQFYIAEPPTILAVIGAAMVGFLSFQSAVFLNDYFDVEGDRIANNVTPVSAGAIAPKTSLALFAVTGLLSLLFALTLKPTAAIFVLIFHFLSAIYSVPPVRIKRFYPVSIFSLSLWAWMMMLAGFAVWAGGKTMSLFPPRITVLVIATITLAFGTKDAKDIAGDRSQGVISLFTLLGAKWGARVNGVLVLVSYLVAPLIVNYPKLYFVAVPCGVLSVWICLRKRVNENLIFLIYYVLGLAILGLIITGKLFAL
jgi:homogentisate phytyltransferase/homogentisate geranylgeranyltransferase